MFCATQAGSLLFMAVSVLLSFNGGSASTRKNVLFIMVDDMRPELSFLYGERDNMYLGMSTPKMDALAARSLVLKRAYVQQAVCGPSRASLLTGRRPDTTKTYDTNTYFRTAGGNFSTIPEYFKNNGYISVGMGKIFHNGGSGTANDPPSWTSYYNPSKKYREDTSESWKVVLNNDTKLNNRPLADTSIAEIAGSILAEFGAGGMYENDNFFIAVGFHKPHLPIYFMKDSEISGSVGLADNPYVPDKMPDLAWNAYAELRKYSDIKAANVSGNFNTSLPDSKAEELRKAYFGAIMWIDTLVGQVVQNVTNLGLENDTIIALMGDHGWHLGEHNLWCKQTNFEESLWTPLMFHIPGVTDNGINSHSIVEFVDIFPTLVEAAGLPTLSTCPNISTNVRNCTEGVSLMPLITNSSEVLKKGAVSQNTRKRNNGVDLYMGYTLRTPDFRYTEWVLFRNGYTDWTNVTIKDVELYDHRTDPRENYNVANNTAYNQDVQDLSSILRDIVYQ